MSTPKSTLASAFAGIKAAQSPEAGSDPRRKSAQEAPHLVAKPRPAAAGKSAKSTNPDFEPVKIYIRKDTRKAAARLWEDRDGGDFSELVEHLLSEYLGT
jgi:hypothetical protein